VLRKLKEEDGLVPFSGSDSEQVVHEPRLDGRIVLRYPPDSARSPTCPPEIWTSSARTLGRLLAYSFGEAKQVTSIALPLFEVREAPDGRLLAAGRDGKLWSFRADGTERTSFTDLENLAGHVHVVERVPG
jgi:hypothetical protein